MDMTPIRRRNWLDTVLLVLTAALALPVILVGLVLLIPALLVSIVHSHRRPPFRRLGYGP